MALDQQKVKSLLENRGFIDRIFYVLLSIGTAWFIVYTRQKAIPDLAFYISFILIPLYTLGFYWRTVSYFFPKNWFYAVFVIVSLVAFFYTGFYLYEAMCVWAFSSTDPTKKEMVETFYYVPVGYEFLLFICANFYGIALSIALSLPFKIVYSILYDSDNFYYKDTIFDQLNKIAYPEKYAQKEKEAKQVKKQEHKFDLLNETQLQAELTSALKEERFEDADKIKKILETKYR